MVLRTFENLLFGSRHERSFQSDSQRVADESTQLADLTQISGLSPIGKMSILERNHLFSVMAPRFEVKWHFRDHDQAICLLIVPCGHHRHRIPPTHHDNHSHKCACRLIFFYSRRRETCSILAGRVSYAADCFPDGFTTRHDDSPNRQRWMSYSRCCCYHLGQVGTQAGSRESAEARQSRTDLILLMCAFGEVSKGVAVDQVSIAMSK